MRQADYDGGRIIEYSPSSSELALERMCEYFGASLKRAFVSVENGIRLVRIAKPGIIETPNGFAVTGFQHTRFDIDHPQRALEAFNASRFGKTGRPLKPLDLGGLVEELKKEDESEGRNESEIIIRRITKPLCYQHLRLARWEKGVYFVAYEAKSEKDAEEIARKLEGYRIHEVPEIKPEPLVHITLGIEPIFFNGSIREDDTDIYDSLHIEFPALNRAHNLGIHAAKELAHIDREGRKEAKRIPETNLEKRFSVYREIHSSVPRGQTMSFITAYLNRLLRNKEFW